MKAFSLILLLQAIALLANAQLEQTARAEFPNEIGDGYYHHYLLEQGGVMVINQNETTSNGERNLRLWQLDESLLVKGSVDLSVNYRYRLLGQAATLDSYYILYRRLDGRFFRYIIHRVNISTGQVDEIEIPDALAMDLEYFEAVGQSVVFGGYENNKPVVICYDLLTGKNWTVQNIFENRYLILDIEIDHQSSEFDVLIRHRLNGGFQTVQALSYNQYGDLLSSVQLQNDQEYSLLDGAVTKLSSTDAIVIGTYSRHRGRYARGVYIARIEDGKQRFITFKNFAELENFFGYMREGRRRRVERRTAKRLDAGKDPTLNYRMLLHKVELVNGQYVALFEAFRPEYSRSGLPIVGQSTRMYNIPSSNGEMFLVGIQYTHALAIGVDQSGQLMWNQIIDTDDILARELRRYVHLAPVHERRGSVFMYSFDESVITKVVNGTETLEGKIEHPIPGKTEEDKVSNFNNFNDIFIEYWPGHGFLLTGFQDIRNTDPRDNETSRDVFVVSKLRYR